MGSWTLSSSPAQFTLKQERTYPLSAPCLLSCAFPPSSAAFPPPSSSLRFCSSFARVPLPISPDGSEAGDVIILHVTGMTCGGCSASVKRILESQPQVSSATVNLTTETAIVLPVTEAKASPNWSKQLGESLAKHLSSCGFPSNLGGGRFLIFTRNLHHGIEEIKCKQVQGSHPDHSLPPRPTRMAKGVCYWQLHPKRNHPGLVSISNYDNRKRVSTKGDTVLDLEGDNQL